MGVKVFASRPHIKVYVCMYYTFEHNTIFTKIVDSSIFMHVSYASGHRVEVKKRKNFEFEHIFHSPPHPSPLSLPPPNLI